MQRLLRYLRRRLDARLRIVRLLPAAGPRLVLGSFALNVLGGAMPVAFIIATSVVVGRVPSAVEHGLDSPEWASLRNALLAAGALFLLATLQPLLLLLLLFARPPLLGTRWSFEHLDAVQLANADRMRRATHLLDLATRQDAAKEVRVFGLENELRRRLRDARRELRRRLFRAQARGVLTIAAGQLA